MRSSQALVDLLGEEFNGLAQNRERLPLRVRVIA